MCHCHCRCVLLTPEHKMFNLFSRRALLVVEVIAIQKMCDARAYNFYFFSTIFIVRRVTVCVHTWNGSIDGSRMEEEKIYWFLFLRLRFMSSDFVEIHFIDLRLLEGGKNENQSKNWFLSRRPLATASGKCFFPPITTAHSSASRNRRWWLTGW